MYRRWILGLYAIAVFVGNSVCYCSETDQIKQKATSKHWLVKQHHVGNFTECESFCILDPECREWELHNSSVSSHSLNRSKHYYTCFLKSDIISTISNKYPEAFESNSLLRSGKRVGDDFKVETLIRGPIAMDSTSIFNFDRHFVRGCSYTISLWMWIWKKRKYDPHNDQSHHDPVSIFSTRRINPPTSTLPPLYPAIIYNVGRAAMQDRLFFSVAKDSSDHFTGIWGNNYNKPLRQRRHYDASRANNSHSSSVRYHEWVHYALTINETTLVGYINGEFSEYVHMFPSDNRNVCPYSSLLSLSSVDPRFPVSNTILQIGGNRGEKTVTGMVQDFVVVTNKALDQREIRQLMQQSTSTQVIGKVGPTGNSPGTPKQMPTLAALMELYGIYSLEGYCIPDWLGDAFLMKEWGLCPDIVCGVICLPEEFFLGIQDLASDDYSDSNLTSNKATSSSTASMSSSMTAMLAHSIGSMLDPTYLSEFAAIRESIYSTIGANSTEDLYNNSLIDFEQLSMDIFGIPISELELLVGDILDAEMLVSKQNQQQDTIDDEDYEYDDDEDTETNGDDDLSMAAGQQPQQVKRKQEEMKSNKKNKVGKTDVKVLHSVAAVLEKYSTQDPSAMVDEYVDVDMEQLQRDLEAEGIEVTTKLIADYMEYASNPRRYERQFYGSDENDKHRGYDSKADDLDGYYGDEYDYYNDSEDDLYYGQNGYDDGAFDLTFEQLQEVSVWMEENDVTEKDILDGSVTLDEILDELGYDATKKNSNKQQNIKTKKRKESDKKRASKKTDSMIQSNSMKTPSSRTTANQVPKKSEQSAEQPASSLQNADDSKHERGLPLEESLSSDNLQNTNGNVGVNARSSKAISSKQTFGGTPNSESAAKVIPNKLESTKKKEIKMRQRKSSLESNSGDGRNVTIYSKSSASAASKLSSTVIGLVSNGLSFGKQLAQKAIDSVLVSSNQSNSEKSDALLNPSQQNKTNERIQVEEFLIALLESGLPNPNQRRRTAVNSNDLSMKYMMDAQDLYSSAVVWLTGRYVEMAQDQNLTLKQWREINRERILSCLFLTLFFADDAASAADIDVEWSFAYPSVLSHPARIMLAFKSGFDADDLPMDIARQVHVSTQVANASFSGQTKTAIVESPVLLKALGSIPSFNSLLQNPSVGTMEAGRTEQSHRQEKTNSSNLLLSALATLPTHFVFKMLESSNMNIESLSDLKDTSDMDAIRDNLRQVLNLRIAGLTATEFQAILNSRFTSATVSTNSDRQLQTKTPKAATTVPPRGSPVVDDLYSGITSSSTSVAAAAAAISTNRECSAAATYYFSVAQYVVSHFTEIDTGVGRLESVALEEKDFLGHSGASDDLQLLNEADAELGNVNAQLWLARRHRWGYGGLEPNVFLSRYWYERAAALGNAEALYNIGIYNLYGLAGFAKNEQVALDYFFKAANGSNPFPMALHAIGNHYREHNNNRLARQFYERAAELNSPEGHFSYAMMLREGVGGPIDVPLALVHLAVAASQNHIRSISFLAHGLFDAESWLAQYGRETKLKSQQELQHSMLLQSQSETGTVANSDMNSAIDNKNDKFRNAQPTASNHHKPGIRSRFHYNTSVPITIKIPNTDVDITLPAVPTADCNSALILLKYLSEMGYRTNDLSKAALSSYLAGDFWTALQYYDELSELGISVAQDNAVYLYKHLKELECSQRPNLKGNSGKRWGQLKTLLTMPSEGQSFQSAVFEESGEDISNHEFPTNKPYEQMLSSDIDQEQCQLYFDRMIANRLLQMASFGTAEAFRELAMQINRTPHQAKANASNLNSSSRENNETEFIGNNHDNYVENRGSIAIVEHNSTVAAYLYAVAAALGDVQGLVGLGWMLRSGGDGEFPKNRTAAASAFESARLWESSAIEAEEAVADEWLFVVRDHSYGIAPLFASIFMMLEDGIDYLGLSLLLSKIAAHVSECLCSFHAILSSPVIISFVGSLKDVATAPFLLEGLIGLYCIVVIIRNRRREQLAQRWPE